VTAAPSAATVLALITCGADAMRILSRRSVIAYGLATASVLAVQRRPIAQAAAAGSAEQRLRERGIELPKLSAPVASYVPYVRSENQVYLSGMPPRRPDGTLATGKVGRDVTVEEAYQHARLVGLALLATMREAAGGSLDNVARVVKVTGMVNAVPEFTDHPKVINGCSDLFVEVFGDKGRHARSAVGMASLPFNITVEIEAIVEVT
jgi:enamine deaminase RidA (YjgF/YER057c/UK114 family)